ncbi:ubiquitin-conjugating enzyme (huntingtin interacting protein 2) [Geosmithia morbida]|uniref:Ubiquitin-conjugating enzyme E2 2 n=1 Tax=Geosmithia morbida TaxID=1094350 RepID=A0A9P4YST3_9HYPO|nr:ubiquitin-conjugating enzyme (huntingtin interacting protein 2) [Geosmithia morbida]KAF4121872.1 ubiquitin-conjugating enzyme (huntingtin interacting protein 2) [Geosmithia morbida]
MSSTRDRRVAKELQDIQADRDNSGVSAVPADGSSLSSLYGYITGPPDTPYAGGTYHIKITIPDSYPFKPPIMSFITKIYHPNISSQTGAICLDTLSTGWSPVQTIKTALLSLRMLLEFPNPKDPQDAQVAKLAMDDPEQYARIAHQWAVSYAGAPDTHFDSSKYRKDGDQKATPVGEEQYVFFLSFFLFSLSALPFSFPYFFHRRKTDRIHNRYMGYHKNLVGRFTSMGFEVSAVVNAFIRAGLPRKNGADYEPEEAYLGDVTAHLLGES